MLNEINGYMGWLGTMQPTLVGGVATYFSQDQDLKIGEPDLMMPEWLKDTGCLQMFPIEGVAIINAYFPYSNPSDEKWSQIRRQWDYELHDYLVALSKKMPVIMCADMNIVRENIDAWDDKSVGTSGGFLPWEHKNFDSMMKAAEMVDSYRILHLETRGYTYFFQNSDEHRQQNQGHRIDYFMVSSSLMPAVKRSEIITDYKDTTNNPILLEF